VFAGESYCQGGPLPGRAAAREGRYRVKYKSLSAILLLFSVFQAIASPGEKPGEKIDEKVVSLMRTRPGLRRYPVVLLGKTQLLEPPGGFERFCKTRAGRKRSVLRREVVAKLKSIARKEQPEILKALGNPEGARRLWIVNAVFANLTAAEIKKAARLNAVKYIYRGKRARRGPEIARTVQSVLKPEKRAPFTPKGKKIPWNLRAVKADRVWKELNVTGEGAVVAMLDVGVNYLHEELRRNIWINEEEVPNNGVDDDANGYVDDLYGYNFVAGTPEVMTNPQGRTQHGSLTSGIVAGDGTGGTVTGVAPRAKIMPLVGSGCFAAFSFQYALENSADIVNMSFSIPNLGNGRGFWRMMSDHAVCAGLVLVSGAGNFQQKVPIPIQIRIPEGIPSVICAGGVDRKLNVPRFCSLGPVEWASVKFYGDYPLKDGKGGLIKPDICGFPGPRYPVIHPRKGKGYIDPNRRLRGNSFSSPHISGIAALMLSANPELPAWLVKEILEETATDIAPPGKDTRTGAGLANAYRAVRKAMKGA
jgi:subtilisin family serine protease